MSTTTTAGGEVKEQIITPWEVEAAPGGSVDYMKLVDQFGSSLISDELIARFEKITGKRAHHFLRRGIFFSHRDLKEILDHHESGKKWFLYTGRGPSSGSLHFGHLLPFLFTKYLQDAFNVPLVIQMTNDEKFLWKGITLEESIEYTHNNVKDIIALGFDIQKTFIFSNLDYIQHLYPNVLKISKCVNMNQIKNIFGFQDSDVIGKFTFPPIQAAPCFPDSFPHIFSPTDPETKNVRCLIPCAIDQDPYFRMTRDISNRIGFSKPSLIHSKFFPALQGHNTKMSASQTNSAIYLSDTPEIVKEKIKHAFSGGGATKEEQIKNGANLDVDITYEYLTFFLEDDAQLAEIAEKYSTGKMLTGEIKKILMDILNKIILRHKESRAKITDEVLSTFMSIRKLNF